MFDLYYKFSRHFTESGQRQPCQKQLKATDGTIFSLKSTGLLLRSNEPQSEVLKKPNIPVAIALNILCLDIKCGRFSLLTNCSICVLFCSFSHMEMLQSLPSMRSEPLIKMAMGLLTSESSFVHCPSPQGAVLNRN